MNAKTILQSMALGNAEQAVRCIRVGEGGLAAWHMQEAIKQLEQAGTAAISPLQLAGQKLSEVNPSLTPKQAEKLIQSEANAATTDHLNGNLTNGSSEQGRSCTN